MDFRESEGAVLLVDKSNRPFYIEEAKDLTYLSSLMDMYLGFTPRPNTQGLPPQDDRACADWILGLFSKGINFVARRPKGEIIGHVALLPSMESSEAEYMVFVHQAHRQLGIGTALTRHAIDEARRYGIKRIWLCVSPINIPAIRLYLKVGFVFRRKEREECLMELWTEPPK